MSVTKGSEFEARPVPWFLVYLKAQHYELVSVGPAQRTPVPFVALAVLVACGAGAGVVLVVFFVSGLSCVLASCVLASLRSCPAGTRRVTAPASLSPRGGRKRPAGSLTLHGFETSAKLLECSLCFVTPGQQCAHHLFESGRSSPGQVTELITGRSHSGRER